MTFRVLWLFTERCSIIPIVMTLEHRQSLMTTCFMWLLKIPTENSLYIKRLLLKIFTALSFPDQGLTMMDEFFTQCLGQSQHIREGWSPFGCWKKSNALFYLLLHQRNNCYLNSNNSRTTFTQLHFLDDKMIQTYKQNYTHKRVHVCVIIGMALDELDVHLTNTAP